MSLTFLHFDTVDRYSGTSAFNCNFQLTTPLKRISKIYLKSAEIPIGWYNINEPQKFQLLLSSNLNLITTLSTSTDSDVVAFLDNLFNATNYTTINSLINNFLETTKKANYQAPKPVSVVLQPPMYLPGYIPPTAEEDIPPDLTYIYFEVPPNTYSIGTLSYTINQGIINFLKANKNVDVGSVAPSVTIPESYDYSYNLNITCDDTYGMISGTSKLMTSIMGFLPKQPSTVSGIITAPSLYQLFTDTYISLYLSNIPHNNTNFSFKFCSFKIPITSGIQTILFSGESRDFAQYITVADSNFIMNNLSLIIYDRYGKEITSGPLYNWSFTLGFEIY